MTARRCSFVFLEIVAALGMLGLLTACFIGAMRTLMDMNHVYVSETRAILTLDNAVERAAALPKPSAKQLERLFQCEWTKSQLADEGRLKPVFSNAGGFVEMRILKANGKPLAEVKVKCAE